ncbi:MAG: TlpA disulfide reductase family protein [Gammaproteobacteria bacterium]
MIKRRPTFLMATLLVAALAVAGSVSAARNLVGSPAPDFTLSGLSGANLRLSEYQGRVVMINFWATWCGPCRQEMPALQTIYQRYEPAGFTLLGVNVDAEPDGARRMAEDLGVSFPLLFDADKDVSKLYDVRAMPVTVLVDRDGRVRYVHHGYKPGYEERYLDQVRTLLRED